MAEERHLRKRDPWRWAAMPQVEQSAYTLGWLDSAALAADHIAEWRKDRDTAQTSEQQ